MNKTRGKEGKKSGGKLKGTKNKQK